MARHKKASTPQGHPKRGWFKRLLERIAKSHQKTGGQICAS
ncbi:MAG: hypothetical protein SWH78_14795 [Thermodesulfobacteriota bacterium]|nr:hypothetical protein [Thermodesulfobacteriota bacterium]